jgi:hypothetical protein
MEENGNLEAKLTVKQTKKMEKKYYIYEIPGVKIGCTWNVKRRVEKAQGYTDYKILEQHTDIMEASKREIELQKHYGYKVDKLPYYKTLLSGTDEGRSKAGIISGKKAAESGQLASIRGLGGKISGKLKRKLTFNQAQEIKEKFQKMDGGKMERYDTLAAEYNVSNTAIRYIIKNKTYTEK